MMTSTSRNKMCQIKVVRFEFRVRFLDRIPEILLRFGRLEPVHWQNAIHILRAMESRWRGRVSERKSSAAKKRDLGWRRQIAVQFLQYPKRIAHDFGFPRHSHLMSGPPPNGVTPVWLTKRDQCGRSPVECGFRSCKFSLR